MKKILYSVLALAFVLTGCKEEKNPPLSMTDVKTHVAITGQVMYESDLVLVPNQYYPNVFDYFQVVDTLPVKAGLHVEVRVDYGMYKDGTALNRFATFSGLTDSTGFFRVEIPVPATMNTFVVADLKMESFFLDNYPIPNPILVPVTYGGMYSIDYPSYEIIRKRVYFDGNMPTLFAALPASLVASPDTTYVREYYLGAELITNPGAPANITGTPFVVLP